MTNSSANEIYNAIISAKNPICVIDSRFDYDAFGSAYALLTVMENLGKPLKLIYNGKIPSYAEPEFDSHKVAQGVDLAIFDFNPYDVLVTVDCPAVYHLSSNRAEINFPSHTKVINIDHHFSNTLFGNLNYVYHKSSTCRLLFDILFANNVDIDVKIGTYLMKGLLTDSGILQYDEVDQGDFDMVSYLMKVGVKYKDIVWDLTNNQSSDSIKFMRFIYDHMVINYEERYAHLAYLNSDLESEGIDSENVAINASDVMRKMSMVDYVFSIRNDKNINGKWWIGFRSRLKDLDVSKYAAQLGGGGHRMAAGATLENIETLEEAVDKVKESIKKAQEK